MTELTKAFCISCGEETPLEKVDLGMEGDELYRCALCGAYLGTKKSLETIPQNQELTQPLAPGLWKAARPEPEISPDFHPEASSVAEGPIPEVPTETEPAGQFPTRSEDEIFTPEPGPEAEAPKFESIILAEDSELVSRILKEMIIKKGLSNRVISCKNGFEFTISYLQNQRGKVPIGLIILDVIMPVLNGISAAVAIRCWEKALELEPVPILFFTAKRCDETFKRVLQYSRPAMYVNKGASESASSLEQRIEKIINQLLKEIF